MTYTPVHDVDTTILNIAITMGIDIYDHLDNSTKFDSPEASILFQVSMDDRGDMEWGDTEMYGVYATWFSTHEDGEQGWILETTSRGFVSAKDCTRTTAKEYEQRWIDWNTCKTHDENYENCGCDPTEEQE